MEGVAISLGGTSLVWVVALPFVAALALLALPNKARDTAALVAGLATLAALVLLGSFGPAVFAGLVPSVAWPWLPLEGADFGFRADGWAWTFAMLVLAIGALVILYARYYLSDQDPIARFYAFFMLFMGAMLGIVLADNLILLVVFWELTSLSSFLLIGYWQGRAEARQGARMALAITGAGGLALLAGVLILGHVTGSYKLDVVLASGDLIRASEWYLPALLLVLLGAFTKSAQFPFHFWLPHAMAAPTPVSAYLHSATMVKAGVFLIGRLYPALSGTEAWLYIVTLVGLATLLVGAYVAVFQHDLKGLLAYSTISHLGLITLLFGLGTPLAPIAAVFHVLNHATFKASLFMAAGIIDHESGSRDMRRLNGLWRYMPVTAVLAIVASAAMAGVPLMNGFLSKEMFLAETLTLEAHPILTVGVPILATLAAGFSVAYSARFIHDVFWNGEPVDLPKKPHDPPVWMMVPVAVLAVLCLAVGLAPNLIVGDVLALAAQSVTGTALPYYSLKIWHGLNLPLLMSVLALSAGVVFYVLLQRLYRLHDKVHLPRGGREVFDLLLAWLLRASRSLVERVVNGRLQRYAALTIAAAVILGGWPLASGGWSLGSLPLSPAPFGAWLVFVIAAVAIGAVVALHRQRLIALVLLGAVGLMVSLTFALLSAPDLALTQLLVEVASVILLMLALHYLPETSPPERTPRPSQLRDAAIAAAAGLGVAALVLAVLTRPQDSGLADWLLTQAVPGAAGTNAVNVIIVDFRAFDTLGEIAVLGIAGLIVFGLISGSRLLGRGGARTTADDDGRSLMLQVTGRALLPLSAVVALWFFLRGHNLPGGGFIAGLILALGLLIPYLGHGVDWVENRMRARYDRWIGAGLFVAGLTGIGSFVFAHPFLTSTYLSPELPLVGKVPIASAMFFDIGVFATVTGATLLALSILGRAQRAAPGKAEA